MPSSRAACPAALLIFPPAPRRAFTPRHPIVCTAEQYIQDEVSGISERRRGIAAAIIVFAVLTLIPMAPDLADVASMGVPSDFI
jgi:hypothetical protein